MNGRERDSLEQRAQTLFHDSVENLDMRMQSRLTQARHAALEAAARRRAGSTRKAWWMPAAGVTAAAVVSAALWMAAPSVPPGTTPAHRAVSLTDAQSNLEDLDIVAASDESGDPLEMLQDDLDFYDFADKAGTAEPAA